MATTIEIDLNVRVRGSQTFAGLEDATGPLVVGGAVTVREPESGLVGSGTVVKVDAGRRLVYLAVDWSSLRQPDGLGDEFAPFAAESLEWAEATWAAGGESWPPYG